ncbi:MAG TPA: Hsp20/alpha crystallin family protein [Methanotrichaceae archaeon]|nr:Hsp20/alpha crystallin family protein [Methanotrichaceae archaeon]
MAGIIPSELNQLQDMMNKFMDYMGVSGLGSRIPGGEVMRPLADVRDADDAIIVTMDLPGVDKNDVEISVSENELRVVAEKSTEETPGNGQGRFERTYRRFERTIMLPELVKANEARARLENGVLEISLPKEVVTTRKQINIE